MPDQVKGTDTAIMLAFEDAGDYNGTIDTPAGYLMPFDSCGVLASQSNSENNTILSGRHKGKPSRGNVDVGGSVVGLLGPNSAGIWFKALMGDHAKTGTGPFEHVFTVADDVPSFALQKDLGSKLGATRFETFGGAKIASLDINLTQEGRQSVTVNVKGASQVFGAAALDASPVDYRLDEPWDGLNLFIKEGGAQIGVANAANLSISNNLDESTGYTIPKEADKLKAGTRQSLSAQFLTITGGLTALLTDTVLIQKGIDNIESSLEFKLVRGTGDGTVGNESLVLDIPNIVYERTSPDISGPAGLLFAANFEGFGGFTATLNNSEDL